MQYDKFEGGKFDGADDGGFDGADDGGFDGADDGGFGGADDSGFDGAGFGGADFGGGELTCQEFKSRLDHVLDQRKQPRHDWRLISHAQQCGRCADWLAAHNSLLAHVGDLPAVEPRPDFSLRVLQEVESQRRQAGRRRTWTVAALSVAAGLFIAVLGWRNSDRPAAVENRRDDLLAQAIALEAHKQLAEGTKQVAEGFKPVTTSVYSALNAVWRTLPGSEFLPGRELAQTIL